MHTFTEQKLAHAYLNLLQRALGNRNFLNSTVIRLHEAQARRIPAHTLRGYSQATVVGKCTAITVAFDNSMRENDWRSRKRVTQATSA